MANLSNNNFAFGIDLSRYNTSLERSGTPEAKRSGADGRILYFKNGAKS